MLETTQSRPSASSTSASDVAIVPVTDKAGKSRFIGFPYKLYDRTQEEFANWVPPLRMAVEESLDTVKNPFYKRAQIQLFLAERGGKVVGRIAAVKNDAHIEYHKEPVGHYGFFECINDQAVADALFAAASNWLKERGLKIMRGPMNPSTNHECGLLVRGQSQHPTIMTTWNPKYYEELHDKAGFVKAKDLVAYWLPTDKGVDLPPKVIAYADRLKRQGNFTFRDFSLKEFDRDVEIAFDIYNSAWEDNWGFVPMNWEEFKFSAKDMKMALDPRFAFIAEKDGKPAGFMLALPDLNHVFKRIPNGRLFPTGIFKLLIGKKMMKSVRILTLGVKKEYRHGGIFALFTVESFRRAKRYGLVGGEPSWILEDNEGMNKPWRDLGAPLYRRWRIFDREVR
ncbi:MAG: hypothetical protein IT285_12225 [Bdellovibrionales bacterium]|nr:hypothetical protein [Bdellovibrionales bacterium]